MDDLLNTKWKATRADTPPLEGDELNTYLEKLNNGWQVLDGKQLSKEFEFSNFQKALDYTNKVGEFAEEKNHHPDIHLSWGKSKIEIWTHRIGGLAPMDFVWAANVEKIYQDNFQ